MEVIEVQPRDFYLYYVYVPVKGTTLRWTFTTSKNNIAFGLYHTLDQTPLPSSEMVLRAQQAITDSTHSNNKGDYASSEHSTINLTSSPVLARARSKSVASEKLKENNGWVEIIPIERANSVKTKVEGFHTAQDAGNYILVFDNTFSKKTPKFVTFSVALVDPNMEQALDQSQVVMDGYLFKKKRKRLQGWAKRWFELSKAGVLSYSTSPDTVTRGSIQVFQSTVTPDPKQRLIHIDSGTTLFHLKCELDDIYEKWTEKLKEFAQTDPSLRRDNSSTTIPKLQIGQQNPTAQSISSETIQSQINQGVENAELLSSTLSSAFQKTENTATISSEQHKILQNLANEQIKQWKEVQTTLSRLLNSNPSLTVTAATTKDMSDQFDDDSVDDFTSASDRFYDANSFILSGEGDEDDADFVNIGHADESSSDSSSVSTSFESDSGEDTDNENMVNDNGGSRNYKAIDSHNISFHRRHSLPAPSGEGISHISLFKKNIGKDLSQIAMPIAINEPISLLQKACEDLEYCELLETAASCDDSLDRLKYVTAFAVSTYASSQWRIGRKPFNPVMSETYECIRPDKGFRFIAEKVSHHPVIIACHAESTQYKFWASNTVKSKFWGKTMELMTEGTYHVELNNNEHYTFTKPSSWLKNMIVGEKYLEHSGDLKVVNQTTGEYAEAKFDEGTGGGLFGAPKKCNTVTATLCSKTGEKQKKITGKWSEALTEDVGMNRKTFTLLWEAKKPADTNHCEKYYGFTQFAMELNEITPIEDHKLPKTDSRYRPDQRLYENGESDEADKKKTEIEVKQRETRATLEAEGKSWKPIWFELKEDGTGEGDSWQFAGQYWKAREKGEWPSDTPDLW